VTDGEKFTETMMESATIRKIYTNGDCMKQDSDLLFDLVISLSEDAIKQKDLAQKCTGNPIQYTLHMEASVKMKAQSRALTRLMCAAARERIAKKAFRLPSVSYLK